MNSLDANVVLRFLLWDVPEQAKKAEQLIGYSACYVTDVIVTEVVFVLERVEGMERADIGRLLLKFLALPTVSSNERVLSRCLDLYTRRKALSFPDCYSAIEALQQGADLTTFDKDLIKHGGSHVKQP
jgi:predicted nucleic-acid-binding protein